VVLQELARLDHAAEAYQRAIALDDRLFRAHYRLGTIYDAQDKPREADKEYRKAIEINARFTKPFVKLGYLYLNNDYVDEAVRVFRAGIGVDEHDAELANGLGASFAAKGEYADAVKAFETALRLDRDMLDALYNLGMAEFELGKKEAAQKHLEEFAARGAGQGLGAFGLRRDRHGRRRCRATGAPHQAALEHFQLGPVEGVAERSLDLAVPPRSDDADPFSQACLGNNVDIVQIRHRGMRKSLLHSQREFLWDASNGRRHLRNDDLGQVRIRRCTAEQHHRTPPDGRWKLRPADFILPHRGRRRRADDLAVSHTRASK